MTPQMIKYPKIGQFRDVVYEVKQQSSYVGQDENDEPIYQAPDKLPILKFGGTVKLHGTNASVVKTVSGIHYQSRNRIISPTDDNAGFATWAVGVDWEPVFDLIQDASNQEQFDEIAIYGEWCGQGIQTGVAIAELPKMFVVFGVKVNGEWLPSFLLSSITGDIPAITDFDTYEIEIDFNQPEQAVAELTAITDQVELLCPVGAACGVKGVGEGVVWTCSDLDWKRGSLRFKVKGEKHSKSKVKVLNPVDAEKIGKARGLASQLMTQERLNQGIQYLEEMKLEVHRKNLGPFLKHVVSDCIAEEQLTLIDAGLQSKEIGKHLSDVARTWFFENELQAA